MLANLDVCPSRYKTWTKSMKASLRIIAEKALGVVFMHLLRGKSQCHSVPSCVAPAYFGLLANRGVQMCLFVQLPEFPRQHASSVNTSVHLFPSPCLQGKDGAMLTVDLPHSYSFIDQQ